jgi:replicative superfamily II helicase
MPGSGKKMGNNENNGSNGKAQHPLNFAKRSIASIPTGRKGKHNVIVAKILADLDRLDMETAILVPLDGLNGEKMENVRSALNRATRQKKISVATSTDDQYFYVWRTEPKKSQATTVPDKLASQTRRWQ